MAVTEGPPHGRADGHVVIVLLITIYLCHFHEGPAHADRHFAPLAFVFSRQRFEQDGVILLPILRAEGLNLLLLLHVVHGSIHRKGLHLAEVYAAEVEAMHGLPERIPQALGGFPIEDGGPQLCGPVGELAVGLIAPPPEVVVADLGLRQVGHGLKLLLAVGEGAVRAHLAALAPVVGAELRLPELTLQLWRQQSIHRIHRPLRGHGVADHHRLDGVPTLHPLRCKRLDPLHF
mmetsp:Transcript_30252/g.72175  ORF Transcript_30252/g.72175 Transcript_30252/m.72175 type:complete len:233 (-) Transcript_30252:2077-2775(-)